MTATSRGDAPLNATREYCQLLRADMHAAEPEWVTQATRLVSGLSRALAYLPDGQVREELVELVHDHDAKVVAWHGAADLYFLACEQAARAEAASTAIMAVGTSAPPE